MVKAETDNFKGLHHEIEAKDLSIVSISFKIIAIREVHHNKIVLNMPTLISPIFRGIRATLTEAEAWLWTSTFQRMRSWQGQLSEQHWNVSVSVLHT